MLKHQGLQELDLKKCSRLKDENGIVFSITELEKGRNHQAVRYLDCYHICWSWGGGHLRSWRTGRWGRVRWLFNQNDKMRTHGGQSAEKPLDFSFSPHRWHTEQQGSEGNIQWRSGPLSHPIRTGPSQRCVPADYKRRENLNQNHHQV